MNLLFVADSLEAFKTAKDTTFSTSPDIVTPTLRSGLAPWREKLFAHMHHSATAAAEFLNLPSNAVVELGSKVEI